MKVNVNAKRKSFLKERMQVYEANIKGNQRKSAQHEVNSIFHDVQPLKNASIWTKQGIVTGISNRSIEDWH